MDKGWNKTPQENGYYIMRQPGSNHWQRRCSVKVENGYVTFADGNRFEVERMTGHEWKRCGKWHAGLNRIVARVMYALSRGSYD